MSFSGLFLSSFCLYRLVCRSGVNVPGLRYVDAIEGLLGIEWIEGKSIKYLLSSGAQEEFHEDEDIDLDDTSSLVTDEDPLKEFGMSVGMSYLFENDICIISRTLRCSHGLDRCRTSENAYRRYHSRRSNYFEHDAPTSFFISSSRCHYSDPSGMTMFTYSCRDLVLSYSDCIIII